MGGVSVIPGNASFPRSGMVSSANRHPIPTRIAIRRLRRNRSNRRPLLYRVASPPRKLRPSMFDVEFEEWFEELEKFFTKRRTHAHPRLARLSSEPLKAKPLVPEAEGTRGILPRSQPLRGRSSASESG